MFNLIDEYLLLGVLHVLKAGTIFCGKCLFREMIF